MKYLFLIALLLGCTHLTPKYKVGDCIDMSAMTITDKGTWDSSGYILGSFKVIDIIHTEKLNTYMADRLHATDYYKIKMVEGFKKYEKYTQHTFFVIPISDLDSYRYATTFWELPENNKHNCNEYPGK